MRITSTICTLFLITSGAFGQSLSREQAIAVTDNISRALAIYATRKQPSRAGKYVRAVEKALGRTDFDRENSSELEGALQDARYSLVNLELFFNAKSRWNRFKQEDQWAVEELGAERYNCAAKDRDGNSSGLVIDRCIANAFSTAKRNRDRVLSLLR